jgi:hypothetical protein
VRPAKIPKADVDANAAVEPNHTAIGAAVLLKATTAIDFQKINFLSSKKLL